MCVFHTISLSDRLTIWN